ncbi:hypothetical protein [Idiomarina ramblicola]|uniref:Uncharacterized protein n=1 Tax=Idiomarina ramblicola TaxID=263724 RepID=A0A432YYI3_9GAMM|nr:hypothetical protein [Idiomarina ramblicola]RUO68438.1 hypothetical protein CWI78_09485 [Idiomarina ramblicola]
MAKTASEKHSYFLAIVFTLLGILGIVDYVYMDSFHTDDLLKGIGFLLMVPLAYFYPSAYSFKKASTSTRAALWSEYLSYVGITLVIAGFILRWL